MTPIRETLRQCAKQFRMYAENHIAKDQIGKARTNEMFAGLCEEALTQLEPDSFLKRLRDQSGARADEWHGNEKWTILEWAGAMAGEAGEAANAAKKIRRMQQRIARRPEETTVQGMQIARAKLAEEIADTIIYLDLLAAQAEIDIESAVVTKFNAVSEQFGFPQRL